MCILWLSTSRNRASSHRGSAHSPGRWLPTDWFSSWKLWHTGTIIVCAKSPQQEQIIYLLTFFMQQVALTSEACLKGLPKTSAGEVVAFKGWPKLHWFVTEHLGKTPKDWMPPPRLTDDTPAYIEYTTDKDGSVMGVTVTRAAMMAHCRALTQACGYTEGECAVCVLDFKREVGLWHATLTSILNGMHVIFIPYALMKVSSLSVILFPFFSSY